MSSDKASANLQKIQRTGHVKMKVRVCIMGKTHTQQSMEKSGFLQKKKKRGRKKGDGGREGCGRGLYTLKNNQERAINLIWVAV